MTHGGPWGRRPGMANLGLVRINGRGRCPVCGQRHAVCTSPDQPEPLYPPLDTRTVPLRPEMRFNAPEPEREAMMPLVRAIDLTGRPQMAAGDYVSDRRLYLDAQGAVVERGDPNAVSLLVGEGGTVPAARARELGLVNEEQRKDAAPERADSYVVHGPGPDDPGAFYDDGTAATPAGNEGVSDVRQPKSADRERHLANAQESRVTGAMEPTAQAAGMQPRAVSPRSGGSKGAADAPDVPASQDKTAGTVGEPSGDGEEEQRRRAAEAKAEAPVEDKAEDGPRRGRPRGSESK